MINAFVMILLLFMPAGEHKAGVILFDSMEECRAALPARRAEIIADWPHDYVLVCARINE